jgi:hypothetical protein
LIENASRAFFDAKRKSMRQIRAAIDPDLLTAADQQFEGNTGQRWTEPASAERDPVERLRNSFRNDLLKDAWIFAIAAFLSPMRCSTCGPAGHCRLTLWSGRYR